MTEAERGDIKAKHYAMLNDKLAAAAQYIPSAGNLQGRWGGLVEPQASVSTWDTGVPTPLLQYVGAKSVEVPEHIQLHGHLEKTHVQVPPLSLSPPHTHRAQFSRVTAWQSLE